MKAIDIIEWVDEVRPNGYSTQVKVGWLKELMAKIKEEVIDTHEKEENSTGVVIMKREPEFTEQSILDFPTAHTDVAQYYLMAKIDSTNSDYDRYTNTMILFNNAYLDYRKWYNRTHMPKGVI